MTTTQQKRFFGLFAVALAAAFLLFFELGRMDVWTDNEGQRAAPPYEMLQSNDYIIPTLNGEPYLAKPPLLYWLIAATYRVTGIVDAFTARIPTALFALALIVGVYIALRRNTGEGPARWSAVALMSSVYFLERSRNAEIDVPMAACLFGAIWLYRSACLSPTFGPAALRTVASGALVFMALMFKGPAALPFLWAAWAAHRLTAAPLSGPVAKRLIAASVVLLPIALVLAKVKFPFALIAALAMWSIVLVIAAPGRALRDFGRLAVILAIGVGLSAPWAVAVVQRMGWDYIAALLDNQVVERTHTASIINSGSPFFYLLLVPILLAPWGLLLPLHLSRTRWAKGDGTYRFSLCFGWLSVLVFSLIAGKESEYILPAFAFLLIPTGYHLAAFEAGALTGWTKRWIKGWGAALTILFVILALGGPIYVWREHAEPILLAEVLVLSLASLTAFAVMFIRPDRRLTALSFMWIPLLAAVGAVRGFDYQDERSFKKIGELAGRLKGAGYTVEVDRLYPAFTFYAREAIPLEARSRNAAERFRQSEPYFYVLRESSLKPLRAHLRDTPLHEITTPYTSKDILVVGNVPLPEVLRDRLN